jgi:hypothetical protein
MHEILKESFFLSQNMSKIELGLLGYLRALERVQMATKAVRATLSDMDRFASIGDHASHRCANAKLVIDLDRLSQAEEHAKITMQVMQKDYDPQI